MKPKERINEIKVYIKKHKKEIIILFSIIILLILVSCVIKAANKTKTGNSISNLQNQGIAVIKGSKTFYKKVNNNKNNIYILKNNKSGDKKLRKADASYLNIYKNNLYFIEPEEETQEFNIIKLNIKNKEKSTLVKNVDNNMISVIDGWVYFFQEKILYRIRITGADLIKVCEDEVLNYGIDKDYIYYIFNNGEKNLFVRRKLDEKIYTKIAENVSKDFEIINNRIYFVEQKYNQDKFSYKYALYKMKLNGESKKKVVDLPENIKNINITEDRVFYTIVSEEGAEIYSLKYKGAENTLITKTSVDTPICISNKFIFYMDKNDEGITVIKSKEIN